MNFKEALSQELPIILCNVWDVASAQVAEKLGFSAIGTSSGAMAKMLGYEDGEKMSFAELEYLVKRICATVDLPLSIDLEAGYSRNPEEIVQHIERLSQLGVLGINLEDSLVDKKRELLAAETFAKTLKSIKAQLQLKQIDVFINVRTDPFLLGQKYPLEESIKRAACYQEAGADGIFVPCIEQKEDIQTLVENTSLPVNVMCMPHLPDFKTLGEIGVQRISMGNFLHNEMLGHLEESLIEIKATHSFGSLFC